VKYQHGHFHVAQELLHIECGERDVCGFEFIGGNALAHVTGDSGRLNGIVKAIERGRHQVGEQRPVFLQ
jgi:hypothetical protein